MPYEFGSKPTTQELVAVAQQGNQPLVALNLGDCSVRFEPVCDGVPRLCGRLQWFAVGRLVVRWLIASVRCCWSGG
jgi:hypothetical protein